MMRYLWRVSLVLTVVLGGFEASLAETAGHRYFPLDPGTVWAFGDGMTRMEVSGISEDPDMPVYTISGAFGSFYRVDGDRVLEVTDAGERVVFDMGAEVRSSWTIQRLEGGYDIWSEAEVTMVDRSAILSVPHGSFREVIHLGLRPRAGLADAGITDIWFAPGVGLVQWTEIWFGGVRTRKLSGFRGGRQTMPPVPVRYPNQITEAAGDRIYTLGLDRETYHPGDSIQMRYDVYLDSEAAASDSVTYMFVSTQQIEFAVVDSAGRRVWLWSDGRGFGEALTWFTLTPGDRRHFEGSLLFTRGGELIIRRDNAALPAGRYLLEGHLPTSDLSGEPIPGEPVASEETVVTVPFEVIGQSASDVELKGVVVEVEGRDVVPVPGAQVVVTHLPLVRLEPHGGGIGIGPTGNGPIVETETDAQGEYHVAGLIAGAYRVEASKEGWHTETTTVQLRAGVTPLRILLRRPDPDGFENSNTWDHGRFRGELAVQRIRYAPDDSLKIRYRLIHTGDEPVTFQFSSGQRYDMTLAGPDGPVWRWSADKAFTLATGTLEMASGDTFQVEEALLLSDAGAGASGSYLLEAEMTSMVDQTSMADHMGGGLQGPMGPATHSRHETAAAVKFAVEGEGGAGPTGDLTATLDFLSRPTAPTDSLVVAYRLENAGADTVTLSYPSSQEYDIVLEDSEGWVWVWSSTRLFAASRWTRKLGPGESVEAVERVLPEDVGALSGESYVLRMYQAVESGDGAGISRRQTEARVEFRLADDPENPSGSRKLMGDFDHDRRVGFSDFLLFARVFGRRLLVTEDERRFDLDNNGRVDFEDFLMFAARFGER